MEYLTSKIIENEKVSEGVYKLSIGGNFKGNPGQFYMVRAWQNEPLLSRPISIYDITKDKISFLYSVIGKGTKIFANLKKDDKIKVMGPLGNGFPIDKIDGKIAIVTGGIGIAPMNYVASKLKHCRVDAYCGFREVTFGLENMKEHVENMYISTESGSKGSKGYITDILSVRKYDMVLCCGPEVMMKKVCKMCKENNVSVYVSMEKHMACGVGACLVCTCKTKSGNKRTCKDGPVFSGAELEE